jgi:hypothetical protein
LARKRVADDEEEASVGGGVATEAAPPPPPRDGRSMVFVGREGREVALQGCLAAEEAFSKPIAAKKRKIRRRGRHCRLFLFIRPNREGGAGDVVKTFSVAKTPMPSAERGR